MRQREWTQDELDWLTNNYPNKTDYFCRTYLHISHERLQSMVEKLGLEKTKGKHSREERKPKPQKPPYYRDVDAPGGYCMDCSKYCNITCGRTGRTVGALWQKKCFRGEG